MTPSAYLTGTDDFSTYGVASSTSVAQVTQASTLLDVYLQRPEGLCYLANTDGTPCGMAAKLASKSFKILGALSPGQNITITVSPAIVTPDLIGQTVLIDAVNPDAMETCIVQTTTGNNQITLRCVKYSHAAGANAMFGMGIVEQRTLPKDRPITRIAKTPCVNVLACSGRYSFGRRSDQMAGTLPELNLLTELQTFGGAPAWVDIDPLTLSVSDATGEVWIPAGIYIAYFNEVRMQYVAGWPVGTVPSIIKLATAALINARLATADLGGTITTIKAGDTMIQRAATALTALDADTKAMLEGFRARSFY